MEQYEFEGTVYNVAPNRLEEFKIQFPDANLIEEELEKTNGSQKEDAPVEPNATASNSATSFSELPTYTDNPETVKKAKESGFDVLPGARQEGDTIMGITLPEVEANPLTFEEQLDKEKIQLETKSNNFYTEISKALKVLQNFEKQNQNLLVHWLYHHLIMINLCLFVLCL